MGTSSGVYELNHECAVFSLRTFSREVNVVQSYINNE